MRFCHLTILLPYWDGIQAIGSIAKTSETIWLMRRYLCEEGLTKLFKGVLKINITDGDDDGLLVLSPIESALLQSLKVRCVFDLLLHQILCTEFFFFSVQHWRCECNVTLCIRDMESFCTLKNSICSFSSDNRAMPSRHFEMLRDGIQFPGLKLIDCDTWSVSRLIIVLIGVANWVQILLSLAFQSTGWQVPAHKSPQL